MGGAGAAQRRDGGGGGCGWRGRKRLRRVSGVRQGAPTPSLVLTLSTLIGTASPSASPSSKSHPDSESISPSHPHLSSSLPVCFRLRSRPPPIIIIARARRIRDEHLLGLRPLRVFNPTRRAVQATPTPALSRTCSVVDAHRGRPEIYCVKVCDSARVSLRACHSPSLRRAFRNNLSMLLWAHGCPLASGGYPG
ncbi:hypothetical protein BC628DRAFT_869220 [Trametes gibbosa]|nr:hypothetical protein BC628DRAFT_1005551 [Trametes gibbosa]KAI0820392.1 hypothetical protein BC628DRAFT_869220 [Trametes gibbosa]